MQEKKDALTYFITKIIVALIGVVSLSLQTKYMTPSSLGDFSLVTGFTGALISVCISWIGSSALRYYDKYSLEPYEYYSTIMFSWSAMFGFVILAFISAIWILPSVPISSYLILGIFFALVKSLFDVFENVLRANGKFYFYCSLMLVQNISNVGIFYFFAHSFGLQADALFLSVIISSGVFLCIAFYRIKLFKYVRIKSFSRNMNKLFFSYGIPMIGVWGVSWLLNYSDRFLIKFFYTSYEVGIYDTAYRLSESALGIIISSFSVAFFPALIRRWNNEGKDEAVELINQALEYYLILLVPSILGLAMISNYLYGMIIDKSYAAGVSVTIVSAAGFFFLGINNILYKMWQLEEKPKMVLFLMIISVIVNIVSNVILLPLFDFKVAAATTLASYLISTIITGIWLSRSYKIRIRLKALIQIVFALIPMDIILLLCKSLINNLLTLLMSVIAAALFYLGGLIAAGGLKEEKQQFMILAKKWRKN